MNGLVKEVDSGYSPSMHGIINALEVHSRYFSVHAIQIEREIKPRHFKPPPRPSTAPSTIELTTTNPTTTEQTSTTPTTTYNPIFFQRQIANEELDCRRVFDNDVEYMRGKRISNIEKLKDENLPTDCDSIRARHYFPTEPRSEEERAYPYAITKTVFRVII